MNPFNRRTFLQGSTALGAAMALSGPALLEWAKAWAQAAPWKPEKGAKINLMRWRRFVEAEDAAFVKMINAFKQATGVDVVVTNESFEDIQPKASVVANTGQVYPNLPTSEAVIAHAHHIAQQIVEQHEPRLLPQTAA
jgi:multiple sugar transport system substrate-binding protein